MGKIAASKAIFSFASVERINSTSSGCLLARSFSVSTNVDLNLARDDA